LLDQGKDALRRWQGSARVCVCTVFAGNTDALHLLLQRNLKHTLGFAIEVHAGDKAELDARIVLDQCTKVSR
jgi:hypothetical protein